MDRNAVIEYLGAEWQATQAKMRSALESDISLLNATNSSLLGRTGKQLRPMLSLVMAKACGGERLTGSSVSYAAAAELLHNATLLHDDVVDGSALRRGAPTVASILSGSAAVLIGDFWLSRAVEVLLSDGKECFEVIRVFSKTLNDLAEGEMLQLQKASAGDTTEEDYLRIVYCKTASLFEAACVSGAISVDAPGEYKEAAREYARCIGIAFQIKDDILDYSDADIGKPVGADIREQKITMPLLSALASVSAEKASEIRSRVSGISDHPESVAGIVAFVKEHDGIASATARLHEYCDQAIASLRVLPDTHAKSVLVDLAEYIADREI